MSLVTTQLQTCEQTFQVKQELAKAASHHHREQIHDKQGVWGIRNKGRWATNIATQALERGYNLGAILSQALRITALDQPTGSKIKSRSQHTKELDGH